jgi:CheY-like chemotaxis protein/anti-sigma regulatory factor (Ser/Thr protein kinase)
VPESGCLVAGDRSRLAQVIGNLLTNAARYTPAGGRIRVHAEHQEGAVSIAVSDSGQGLSADLLPRVFDLFVQGPRSAGREQGGLGLGLTIVQQLVRLHGGTVGVVSEGEGRGSTFTIRLPSADVAAHQPALDARPPAPPLVSMRVLVVDDNRDAAETLASVLQARGHKVATAYDAPGAIDAAASFGPAVAIVDIGLPVMDGYELAERLRDRLGHGAPAFIAVTGYGQEHDRARSQRAGFAAHFVKPVDVDHLARQLADLAAPAASST